jgi:hypothetical protein
MTDHVLAFRHGFITELEKIAAAERERAYTRSSGGKVVKPGGVTYTKVRSATRPIRAANLLAKVGQAGLTDLFHNPLFWGTMVGLGGGYMGHQALQDWKLGSQLRAAQRNR